jgi:hypothetical protein
VIVVSISPPVGAQLSIALLTWYVVCYVVVLC